MFLLCGAGDIGRGGGRHCTVRSRVEVGEPAAHHPISSLAEVKMHYSPILDNIQIIILNLALLLIVLVIFHSPLTVLKAYQVLCRPSSATYGHTPIQLFDDDDDVSSGNTARRTDNIQY